MSFQCSITFRNYFALLVVPLKATHRLLLRNIDLFRHEIQLTHILYTNFIVLVVPSKI